MDNLYIICCSIWNYLIQAGNGTQYSINSALLDISKFLSLQHDSYQLSFPVIITNEAGHINITHGVLRASIWLVGSSQQSVLCCHRAQYQHSAGPHSITCFQPTSLV